MSALQKVLLSAFCGGALLLFAILPAEYGIDPTGLGEKLGLLALAKPSTQTSDATPALSFNIESYDPAAERINKPIQGLIQLHDAPFKQQIIDIEIDDLGEVEHKFAMAADTTFVYTWEVLNAKEEGVYYDFHGHPTSENAANFPESFEMAYSRGEGTKQSGAFTSPFAGYHGFYFMNIEEGPITVRLTVSGYWHDHKEMYRAINGKKVAPTNGPS
ncbi:hypothetical protein [Paraglaciecola sp. 2405UD69-4]|uniref:hypothetical protein n=1 Tax=Paraglaciecola sp. 2405UD69-4 TaxID=3391836 RepID=UPI0039C93502